MMERWDAVVVGAGPAGSMAARALAQAGHKVLVLERQRVIGSEIYCAEGLSAFWPRAAGLEFKRSWIAYEVDRVRVFGPSLDYFETQVKGVGWVTERRVLDRDLALAAAETGAHFLQPATFREAERQGEGFVVRFTYKAKEREVFARAIVGADGPASAVGKSLGLDVGVGPKDIHYAAQVLLVDESLEGWLGLYGAPQYAPGGYAWVFPKAPGVANVGVGVAHPEKRLDPLPYLKKFLQEQFPNARALNPILSVVPTGGHRKKFWGDGVVLAGDAARLADPLTGGGLGPAILSGKIAGEVLAEALSEGDLSAGRLAEYPKRFWKIAHKRAYELSYAIREEFFNLTAEDLDFLFRELRPLFHGVSIESFDSFEIGKKILREAPKVAAFALRKGGHAFFNYLKEALFGS